MSYTVYHTIPHQLCRCEVKMCMAYRASFQHILKKVAVCFHPLFAVTNAFNSYAFSKENSAISLEEWVLVYNS